jgi:hypothetical protein
MPITRHAFALLICSAGVASADSSETCAPERPAVARRAAKPAKKSVAASSKLTLAAGGYHESRSLAFRAENAEGVTSYAGVPNYGAAIDAAYFPVSATHDNGWISSLGASASFGKSFGGQVRFDDGEAVADVPIEQSAWQLGAHYKVAAGRFTIDSELGFGQRSYALSDAPQSFEVPDTRYSYLSAGTRLDVAVFEGASIGAGAKYMRALGNGNDMTSMDWYGSGTTSGKAFDANVTVPLQAKLYVKGTLAYSQFDTQFDGVGQITEQEGVTSATDSSTTLSLQLGMRL